MTTTRTRVIAGVAAFAAAAALSSCSTATKESATKESTSASATSSAPAHNADDVMFAQMMIPHHQQAVELSAMVPDRSTDPAVIKLAAAISAAQQPEIDTMKGLLSQWGVPDHSGHDMNMPGMSGMSGMVDVATMAKLQTLKGAEFEKLWLQSMIGHHEGAIAMAKPEVAKGQSTELVEMARTIISSQQAEIDQMKQMLAALGG